MNIKEFKSCKKLEIEESKLDQIYGGLMGLPLIPYYLTVAALKIKEFISDLLQPEEK